MNDKTVREQISEIIYNGVMNKATRLCNDFHREGVITHDQFTSGILKVHDEALEAILQAFRETVPMEIESDWNYSACWNACRQAMLDTLKLKESPINKESYPDPGPESDWLHP